MNNFRVALFAATGLLACSGASAQVLYQPRVILGIQDYELSVESDSANVIGSRILASETFGDSNEGGSISDTVLVGGFGLSALYGTYFADFYIQESLTGDYEDADNFTIENDIQLPDDLVNPTIITDGELDRRDIAVSVGKAFDNGFSLSLGYKTGTSQFSQSAIFGSIPFNTDYEFETQGPFVGLSYGISMGEGTLGFNVALADLSAEYNFRNQFFERTNNPVEDLNGVIKGDATGVTVGINWKAPFPVGDIEGLGYAISVDTYDYDIDLEGDSVGLNPSNPNIFESRTPARLRSSFNENVANIRFAIQYLF